MTQQHNRPLRKRFEASSAMLLRNQMSLLAFCFAVFVGVVVVAVELTEEQHEHLPDFGDPKVAARLKCSACRASALEAFDALMELRTKRGGTRKIKEHEYAELMETMCEDRIGQYGLQLRSNLPTQKFSKDKSISRAQGNWAGRYIMNICGELTTDYEDALITNQFHNLAHFIETMCVREMQVCDRRSVKDETLGDELTAEFHEMLQDAEL